jgi:hypothetical protein
MLLPVEVLYFDLCTDRLIASRLRPCYVELLRKYRNTQKRQFHEQDVVKWRYWIAIAIIDPLRH